MKVLKSEFATHYLRCSRILGRIRVNRSPEPRRAVANGRRRALAVSGRSGRNGGVEPQGALVDACRAETAPYEFAVRLEAKSTMVDWCGGTPAFKSPSR